MDKISIVKKQIKENYDLIYGFKYIVHNPFKFHGNRFHYYDSLDSNYFDCLRAAIRLFDEFRNHDYDAEICCGVDEDKKFDNHCFIRSDGILYDSTGFFNSVNPKHKVNYVLSDSDINSERKHHFHEL